MKGWIRKGWLFLLAVIFLAGCLDQKSGDNVLATFDGGSLTVEDVQAHFRKLKKNPRYKNTRDMLTPEYAFDHAVNMEMIIAKGLKEKLHLDPTIRAEIHGFMADLFLKVMQNSLVPEIKKENFTEEEMQAFFEAHPESYSSPALYDVRVIKAADKVALDGVKAKITSGEITFEEAARAYSTDDATRGKNGAVGKRALRRFRPTWRPVIRVLQPGAVSAPTAIDDAWYLLKLEEKTEPVPQRFEDRKAYVRNDLLYARYREAWQDTYERLKKEFSLQIEDSRLENYLKGDNPL